MFELNTLRAKLQPHLSELAVAFPGRAKPESHYKQQQRFFRAFELDYAVIAQLVADWMAIPEPWVLAADRTQWEVGTTTVNILTLGVVHKGIAFPLVWVKSHTAKPTAIAGAS
ncbi:hypothetical protein S7335_1263 [Synechococcus sp. PCC 7335]|nr:hypothetical protein [Synechococcus sp. PCC 7335]EDX82559.1 hypothetical protein S7335_1263 [Synechococcus sp. PCC 7335]